MLTLRTKLALAVLHDIQYKDYQLSTSLNPSPSEVNVPAAKAIKRTPNSTDRKSTGQSV